MNNWSIQTSELTGPRRLGGRVSKRGFAFQDAYTCLQLVRLLDSVQGLVKVRPEGAQDVDLLYADGQEEYVQLKHEPDEHYTLAALRPILQGFAADLLEAGRPPSLTFTLVARSSHIDTAVTRLRMGEPTPRDITQVAQLVAQSVHGSSAPRCFVELSEPERYQVTQQLLKQTKFLFGMGDEVGGRFSFESHACTDLARQGVAGSDLPSAFNALKATLDGKLEFTRLDVEDLLKRFIGYAAIDLFEGRVEAVTDDLLSRHAEPNRIQQFYAGAPLDWDIIAEHGDIEREQQGDLLRQLGKPSETLRLVCIVAEPGAGKSTLAWRVAAELHRQCGALVVRIRDKEHPGAWYRMTEFYQRVRRPFYVLVDDLFRDPDVVNALRELSPSLPITVLATSRVNEYRPHRVKGEAARVPLEAPSSIEKESVLQRLGRTRADLTPEQRKRLDHANQFLVLMIEVTAGKELREIVRDTLERLHAQDESAYRAYEYLCFICRHGITVPTALLERLDRQGRFHNLPHREAAQGLIFCDEGGAGNLRVGHPVIAETAYGFYEPLRSPATVVQEIVTPVDTSSFVERRFVAHLLRALAGVESAAVHLALPQIGQAIVRCQQSATIRELTIWREFYRNLGQHEQADLCVDAALKLIPASSADCNTLLKLYRERGQEPDALPVLAEWVREHPDLSGARPAYLGLVERYGSGEDLDEAIRQTSAWLAQHPEDTCVRPSYLGLVERCGTDEDRGKAIGQTTTWLAQHPEDAYVRACYLGLVGRKGTPEEVEQVRQEFSNWLLQNPQNEGVRAAYLGFVVSHCSEAVQEAAIDDTSQWLEIHPEAKEVWKTLIPCLLRRQQIGEALAVAERALVHHPAFKEVLAHYLRLTQDNVIDPLEVRRFYEQLVARHPEDIRTLTHYANWLRDNDYSGEAEGYYQRLTGIQGRKTTRVIKRMAHYGYGSLLLKLERYSEAAEQFREVLRSHKGHQMAHDGLAEAMRALGNCAEQGERSDEAVKHFLKAEGEFRQAINWASVNGQSQATFYTHLGWLYIDQERYTEALEAFQSAMDEDPDYFGNYWGVGRALMGSQQYRAAEDALRAALTRAPEDFRPPASEEIPALLKQCQSARSDGKQTAAEEAQTT